VYIKLRKKYKLISLLLILFILLLNLTACKKDYTNEEIIEIMKDALYQKYGEEFVVDGIGTRTANKIKFYQARIYPVSIIGTEKEGDSAYYSDATIDILASGKLGPVSDGYGMIMGREKLENYLSPKINELFGKRFLINSDFKYKIKQEDGSIKWYIPDDFDNAFSNVKDDSDKYRLETELYIYIFDRIDDEQEKDERRQQIFDFVQYLKEEGLFEYLEMGVIFIDERVLAPSYREYTGKIYRAPIEEVIVEGETVYLPPMELREEMSRVLQKEVDEMSEEELLVSMRKFRKSELNYDGIRKYYGQYNSWIYSIKMVELYYNVTKEDRERLYNNSQDVKFKKYKNYIFLNI